MANDVRVRIVLNRFPEITRGLEDRADTIVRTAALNLEAQMKTRAPIDTGFLRGSIQSAAVKRAHWRVTVGADYGLYVEYGTTRNRPQPFRDPAIRAVRPGFIAAMRGVVS